MNNEHNLPLTIPAKLWVRATHLDIGQLITVGWPNGHGFDVYEVLDSEADQGFRFVCSYVVNADGSHTMYVGETL